MLNLQFFLEIKCALYIEYLEVLAWKEVVYSLLNLGLRRLLKWYDICHMSNCYGNLIFAEMNKYRIRNIHLPQVNELN